MSVSSNDSISSKIELSLLAAELYQKQGRLSMKELIGKSKYSAGQIYSLFDSKHELLAYAYPSMVFQYWAMMDQIEDFHRLVISEKLSSFIYSMLEMFADHEHFVRDTFNPLIAKKGITSGFTKEVSEVYKEFLHRDGNLSISAGLITKRYFFDWMSLQFIALVEFWIHDSSKGKERTIGMVDKACTLFESLLYSDVLDKGFDFGRYLISALNETLKREHK
jgi:hypothetical protein